MTYTFLERLMRIYASIGQPRPTSMSKTPRKSFKVAPCKLCSDFVDSQEVHESVQWAVGSPWSWWEPGSEFVAHRRCWRALPEGERKHIRKTASSEPASMGQRA